MFKNARGMGTDLLSIDIQRGRDHGIAPYHQYYSRCMKTKVRNWNDLRPSFSHENILILSRIYESVFDLDLIVGVMLEKKVYNLVGDVARCLMAEQIYRLKYGDRFFYKFTNNPRPFTDGNFSNQMFTYE